MSDYRVQHREFSPDVIEKNIGTAEKPKWKVYICPTGTSRKDNIAHELCEYLNVGGVLQPATG
jgi:hypothetical protein